VLSNVNWGDVPTWLATLAAIGGGGAALYQLVLGRRQLREQQATIAAEFQRQAKRDELVDAQLRQIQVANTALARRQAEQVDIEPSQARHPDPANKSGNAWSVIIRNNSQRPIYEVEGWIKPEPDSEPVLSLSMGKRAMAPFNNVQRELTRTWHRARRVAVIRGGDAFTFRFAYSVEVHPAARLLAHFTDDAGARWQVDHDMSLRPIDPLDPGLPDSESVNVVEA
jgi:hypothetical protein